MYGCDGKINIQIIKDLDRYLFYINISQYLFINKKFKLDIP